MPKIEVELVDAFVDGGAGGNVAGVVSEGGEALTLQQRQEVARQVARSETAFVLASSSADLRLEFYTPTRPIPHCGHATVASIGRLAQLGKLRGAMIVNETVDGPRKINVSAQGTFMEQVPASFALMTGRTAEVAASLGLGEEKLIGGPPVLANNGNKTILVEVDSLETLRSIKPKLPAIRSVTDEFEAVCYYVFARQSVVEGRMASARMFGPSYGIPEEAATGMAAGPLACWLDRGISPKPDLITIEQGQFMDPPSPSVIFARPKREGQNLSGLWVGGNVRVRGKISVEV